ncbi:TetR/AcrR family transcriptional regulator [Mycolicibacterium goodii]|uniref:TetR/AcrR family transcriptional regulator n=1 Tax=Mycolicibacterium goodii TaxID=134601 RepID=A0ABS6HWM9_MYCGD|nr:TetR/AcrR family transcriptional regulator [Mycolicibacterium goodii]MBU8826345.1 TetR/AcrR family transcriptional regulator [Mycolicibacterium goodii]MBU8828769.1 TetR/AcrR family transcriptional regulator [Mycolicibacterium goodii]MBU8839718.1 TetR/AcrR family transcriptional regulator [Mycolicibacterium goodii]OKH72961.1 TetR family transcriptional regulator [Mycobacterium sp. SWH-M5]
MTSSRDRILDAYEDLLAVEGERFATLEAVAARAGVSKGGLLYHFPSKDRLAEALYDRLQFLAAEDVQEMRTAAEGPARHYIRTSHYAGTPLDRALLAVARLQQAGDTRARSVIESVSAEWLNVLHEALGDLEVARAVKLIGDGLYYNALATALGGHSTTTDADDGLLEVVDRIIASVKASRD